MCAVRFALVAPAAHVWHAAPGQKNRKVLAQLVYKVLVSVKFNITSIYLLEEVAADRGNGGGWRRRCGDGASGHGECRADGYYDVTAYSIYNINVKIPCPL